MVALSVPGTVITTAVCSYAFELLGRRWTIFLSFFTTSFVFIYIPYTPPSLTWFYACRIAIGVTMAAPLAHPLLADWVAKKSRGRGLALMGMGVLFGNLFCMGVLFNFTKGMDFKNAFLVAGLTIMGLSFIYLITVKDPDLDKLREKEQNKFKSMNEEENSHLSSKDQAILISKVMWRQIKEKPILGVTIIGGSIVRLFSVLFTTYIILWINSFTEGKNPVLKDF